MKDAAIEVNYWCAEEATYHSGDDRTLPALTVYGEVTDAAVRSLFFW